MGATRITFGSRKSHFTSAPRSVLKLLGFRPERLRASIGFSRGGVPQDVISLSLEIRKGAFCFGREGFLKSGDQSLIEDSARIGLLPRLELRHSQIKERIGVERSFPSAFL